MSVLFNNYPVRSRIVAENEEALIEAERLETVIDKIDCGQHESLDQTSNHTAVDSESLSKATKQEAIDSEILSDAAAKQGLDANDREQQDLADIPTQKFLDSMKQLERHTETPVSFSSVDESEISKDFQDGVPVDAVPEHADMNVVCNQHASSCTYMHCIRIHVCERVGRRGQVCRKMVFVYG